MKKKLDFYDCDNQKDKLNEVVKEKKTTVEYQKIVQTGCEVPEKV